MPTYKGKSYSYDEKGRAKLKKDKAADKKKKKSSSKKTTRKGY